MRRCSYSTKWTASCSDTGMRLIKSQDNPLPSLCLTEDCGQRWTSSNLIYKGRWKIISMNGYMRRLRDPQRNFRLDSGTSQRLPDDRKVATRDGVRTLGTAYTQSDTMTRRPVGRQIADTHTSERTS